MVESITLGSTLLTNANRYCTAINTLSFPTIGSSSAKKGGSSGSKIVQGKPEKLKFSLDWTIVGSSISDLVTQREDFIELLGEILSTGEQTLKISKSNLVDVQIDVHSVSVTGDIKAENKNSTKLLVTFESEYPFLVSQTLYTSTINVINQGGMGIPMGIPMNMGVGGTGAATVSTGGNFEAYPVITFYGPLTSPSITNLTTGKTLNLNITLAASTDYVVIDTFARTALLYPGATNARRYITGDFWTLAKGVNTINIGNPSYTTEGKAVLLYRDHYLNL
jgi:hypothetical protein